ncbi:hypothetical protein ABG768_018837 [Culter alburnus]|uniref:Uncharacterized protein n=1 Tax=Culter alburnus TaxID=194366 RepID=A0AAW2ATE5_CULAL
MGRGPVTREVQALTTQEYTVTREVQAPGGTATRKGQALTAQEGTATRVVQAPSGRPGVAVAGGQVPEHRILRSDATQEQGPGEQSTVGCATGEGRRWRKKKEKAGGEGRAYVRETRSRWG